MQQSRHLCDEPLPGRGKSASPPPNRQSLRAITVFNAVSAYPLPCQGATSGAQLHPDRRHLRLLLPASSPDPFTAAPASFWGSSVICSTGTSTKRSRKGRRANLLLAMRERAAPPASTAACHVVTAEASGSPAREFEMVDGLVEHFQIFFFLLLVTVLEEVPLAIVFNQQSAMATSRRTPVRDDSAQ